MVTRRKKSAPPKHVISASQVGTVINPIAGSLNNTSSFTGQREGKRKSYSFSEKMPPITTQVTSTRRNKDKGKGKSVILKTTPHPKSTPTFLSDSLLLSNQTHTPTREHSTPTPPIFSFGHGSASGQMGNPSPKQDHPSGRHHHSRDSSRSHLNLGLVRSRDDEGLAKHFPTHSEEQELRVSRSLRSGVDAHSKSVVVLPHGSTSSSAPRSNDFKLLCSNLAAVPLRTLTDRTRGGASVQGNCSTENLADNPDGMCCDEQHLSGEADAILHANPSLHSSDQKLNGATGTSETCNDSFPEYLEAERGVDPSMEIEGNPPPPSSTDRPFRFQPCWLNHPDFPRIVKEAWQGHNDNLSTAISEFISSAQTWNSEIFGNIFTNKRRLLARLLGIQKALARHPSSSLLQLQSNLSDELNQILNLEEELWAIKSRTNWLVSGERNTSYFHISTLTRRSANRISGIKDEVGNWLTNLEDIQAHFISGFHSLYQTDQISCQLTPPPLPCWGALLSPDEANSIASPPLDSEILSALNSMKPFKAPDWWLPSGPLRTFISGPLSPGDLSLTVADVHPFGGQWLLDKLSFVLPDHLLLELLATPFSSNPLSNDLVLWAFSSNGAFSLHSAYLLSKGFIPAKPSPSLSTSWIWKAGLKQVLNLLIWWVGPGKEVRSTSPQGLCPHQLCRPRRLASSVPSTTVPLSSSTLPTMKANWIYPFSFFPLYSAEKGNLGVPQFPGQGCSFQSFRTNTYKLSFMESPSGIKIILVTHPRTGDLRESLKYIYNLYVEYVVKNPLYNPGTPIR
ncbi:transposon tx1 uncharacterized 149 kda protein [Fagus crenata]